MMRTQGEAGDSDWLQLAGDTRSPEERPGCLVVLLASGTSKAALREFLARVPASSELALVVACVGDEPLSFAQLSGMTTLPGHEVSEETTVRANHVYLLSTGVGVTLAQGVLHPQTPSEPGVRCSSVERLLSSLASDQGERAVVVVLAETGGEDAQGLKAVKASGGLVMMGDGVATARASAEMPPASSVDLVLPVEEMPARIVKYSKFVRQPERARPLERMPEGTLEYLGRVCGLLRRQVGHEFGGYKAGTVARRIQRRMQVLGESSPERYYERLASDRSETVQLFQELLIGVTHFFRDPEAFAALEREVLPRLFANKGADRSVRVWVPGCSTGEEAFSLAILLREFAGALPNPPRLQIFATDIDETALESARQARYPESIAEHISPTRLARFFTRQGKVYQVNKEVREICLFSTHSLIKDPPFSSLDLISCRNLLIYFDSSLQRRLSSLFHYALSAGGHLFLGPSENVGGPPELFALIDRKWRIYRSREVHSRPHLEFPLAGAVQAPGRPAPAGLRPSGREVGLARVVERVLLEHLAPTCVVVSGDGEVAYFSGRTGRYFEAPTGVPTTHVLSLVRRGLRLELRSLLQQARARRAQVTLPGLRFETDGDGVRSVDLSVRPLHETGEESDLFLILFREAEASEARLTPRPHEPRLHEATIEQLEGELRTTKEQLHSTIEELETANEELKLSNGELLSMNEELQSSNEEMQTSKEELQSINEEMQTVNAELRKKVDDLDRARGDLQNLFASTDIATLFLDRHLRVRQFTPAATQVFRLIESDIGRSIADLAPRVVGADLLEAFRGVLLTSQPVESEVRASGREGHFLMRVRPYRTADERVDGLAVTFLDVTALKRAEEGALQQDELIRQVADAAPLLVAYLDRDLRYRFVNEEYRRRWGLSPGEVVGRRVREVLGDEVQAQITPYCQRVLAGERVSFSLRASVRELGVRDLQVEYIPRRDVNDRVIGFVSISHEPLVPSWPGRAHVGFREALGRLSALARQAPAEVLLEAVVREVAGCLGAEFSAVFRREEDGQLGLRAGVGWRPEVVGTARLPGDAYGQLGYTLVADAPLAVSDLRTDPRFRGPALLTEHGVCSGASVVIAGLEPGAAFGVLSAHTRTRRLFDAADLDFLQRAAALIAFALQREDHARALAEEKQRERSRREQLVAALRAALRDSSAEAASLAQRLDALLAPDADDPAQS